MNPTSTGAASAVPPSPPAPAEPSTELHNRSLRYASLIPTGLLSHLHVTVIGCGAIGSTLLRILTAMGIGEFTICDFDKVSAENLGPQQWDVADIGTPKTAAISRRMLALNPSCTIHTHEGRYSAFLPLSPYVFCCADSMTCRDSVFNATRRNTPFFCDTRMAAEIARVFVVRNPADSAHYLSNLFPQSEVVEAPCTSKATPYGANLAASLAAHALRLALTPSLPYPYEYFAILPDPIASRYLIRIPPEPAPCPPPNQPPLPNAAPSGTTLPVPTPSRSRKRRSSASVASVPSLPLPESTTSPRRRRRSASS